MSQKMQMPRLMVCSRNLTGMTKVRGGIKESPENELEMAWAYIIMLYEEK